MSTGRARRATVAALATLAATASVLIAGGTAARASSPSAVVHPAQALQICGYTSGATCSAMRRLDIPAKSRVAALTSPPAGYTPAQLQQAYDLPSARRGAGQVVGIVTAYDDPTAADDLAVYRTQFGLPDCPVSNGCFRKVNQRGTATPPDDNYLWSQQVSLDMDMVSATCPLCRIVVVEADDASLANLGVAVDQAVALGARYVVNGYTAPESAAERGYDAHYDHPGVLIAANSGDHGSGAGYPAASPYVLAVGGTALRRTAAVDRGWTETAWARQRSGCSRYEPKPAYQHDTLCPGRTVADVSAVDSPSTGVAVYNGYSDPFVGWAVYGGGSDAIIAGIAALNGPQPVTGRPNGYPYTLPTGVTDVTTGGEARCGQPGLCTAAPGYDGPTGLGTPRGDAAFGAPAARGTVSGTVTRAGTAQPIAGATVTAGTESAHTDLAGHYQLVLPAGTYTLHWSRTAYLPATVSGVVVGNGATAVSSTALTPTPDVTISGQVRDGSGGNWPVYARITVRGTSVSAYSDPFSGDYRLTVPAEADYTLDVTPQYPGYQPAAVPARVATADVDQTLRVVVDAQRCSALGYAPASTGVHETFDTGTQPPGWTVVNGAPGVSWTFTDPAGIVNRTGGSGGYAGINSDYGIPGVAEDSSLVSPVADLTSVADPVLVWDTHYVNAVSQIYADISTDGGTTWQTVWSITDVNAPFTGPRTVTVPLPQAAGKPAVQARFRWVAPNQSWYWQVDDVTLGRLGCAPTASGLVAGYVTNRNTGDPAEGAAVSSPDEPGASTTSVATPDDPAVGDGFYALPLPAGRSRLVTDKVTYPVVTQPVAVNPGRTTRHDVALAAPLVSATISRTATAGSHLLGESRTAKVTLHNGGTAPATVTVGEALGTATDLAAPGAAVQRINGTFLPSRARVASPAVSPAGRSAASATAARPAASAAQPAAPWQPLADLPAPVMDNTVGFDRGEVYSVGGEDSGLTSIAGGETYDVRTGLWTPIASMQHARAQAAGAFVNGRFVVTGGWAPDHSTVADTESYDPATDVWTAGAAEPLALAGSATAVLDGKLYVVGGCVLSCGSAAVQVYDPATDTWTRAADYPMLTAMLACGAVNAKLYCAGGVSDGGTDQQQPTPRSSPAAYLYDPSSNAWSRIADAPVDVWGSAYTAADNQLLMSTGVIHNSSAITNEGWRYNPVHDRWSALPNASTPSARSGGSCGFKIGGDTTGSFVPSTTAEVLPGLDGCAGGEDVAWLTGHPDQLSVPAGGTVTFAVTIDAGAVGQPGTYDAALTLSENGPTPVASVPIVMTVTPPPDWGRLTGTVTGTRCGTAAPVPGATVQLTTAAGSVTLTTDALGRYVRWLPAADSPVQIIVAKDGWKPRVASGAVTAGRTAVVDFALVPVASC